MMHLTPNHNNSKTLLSDDAVIINNRLIDNENIDSIPAVIPGELSDAFAMLDPDLASLHKEMKAAQTQYQTSKKSGQGIEAAKWRFETLESAYQTRLMEVRKNKLVAEAALTAVDKGEMAAKKQLHAMTMQERMNENLNRQRKLKEEEKRRQEEKKGGLFFYILLGLWFASLNAQKRAQSLEVSTLQTAFFNARTT